MNSSSLGYSSWLQEFWQDLHPTPGRVGSTLRITLATALALVLFLVLQMPYAAFGLYAVFLTGRESPSASLRNGIAALATISLVVTTEITVVFVTDNDPMARVLSVAAISFIAGMIIVGTNLPALGSSWGLLCITVIAFWENHTPADTLVKNSLRLLAAFSLGIGCAVAVEYIFGVRSPADRLKQQLRSRYEALERMFTVCSRDADPEERFAAASQVSRLAAAGHTGMMALYNEIVDRDLETAGLPVGTRVQITMLAQLMDDAAAFGLRRNIGDDAGSRERCAILAEQFRILLELKAPDSESRFRVGPQEAHGLLDHVESDLASIARMPTFLDGERNRLLLGVPSKKVSVFVPGAIEDPNNVAFSLKVSLCATLCYILYHAIDWPGISTSAITVMVVALTTTGAIKQRFTLRFLGATIGGLILGLGTIALLFPGMDSITSLVVLVGAITFIAAWTSGGPRFNYLGLQIAFAFYLVTLEGFGPATELAPARDRVAGIFLALLVMWFVFDQIWPVRTVTAMRRLLAAVFRSAARLLLLLDATKNPVELLRQTESLRDQVGKNIATLRTLSDAVRYEFGVDREQHVRAGDTILRVSLITAGLIWNQLALFHDEHEADLINQPALAEMRSKIAQHLNFFAEAVVRKNSVGTEKMASITSSLLLGSEQYGQYAQNTIALCEDLHALVSTLSPRA
jgi:multidrug resistance protein MdtO